MSVDSLGDDDLAWARLSLQPRRGVHHISDGGEVLHLPDAHVANVGGTEVQPDPDRLKRYGITLLQLQNALSNSNANVGGDYLSQGATS